MIKYLKKSWAVSQFMTHSNMQCLKVTNYFAVEEVEPKSSLVYDTLWYEVMTKSNMKKFI